MDRAAGQADWFCLPVFPSDHGADLGRKRRNSHVRRATKRAAAQAAGGGVAGSSPAQPPARPPYLGTIGGRVPARCHCAGFGQFPRACAGRRANRESGFADGQRCARSSGGSAAPGRHCAGGRHSRSSRCGAGPPGGAPAGRADGFGGAQRGWGVKFLSLPVKNLRSHRIRSILTSLGIAIALGGMLALVGLSRGIERNWVTFLEGKGTHLLALRKGAIDTMAAALDDKLGDRIRSVPGIARVTAGLGDLVDLDTGEMAYLLGWPLDADMWRTLQITEGKTLGPGEPEGVVLGETLARHLAKRPGDSMQLSGRDFRIVGISRQPSVIEDRAVMMPMAVMQQLLGREGKVSAFHIRFSHPDLAAETGRIQSQLAAMFPQINFVETSEAAKDALVLRLLRAIVWSSSSIAMGMAFMAVLNTLLMSVSERTREIGLLCAIGWRPSRLIAMVID